MDCTEALDHLYELLDKELSPGLETAVREHFDNCKNCFPLYQFETAFSRFLKARDQSARAPEELRKNVLDQIMQEPTAE
jgi:anti-sigma factor (TIGR02949 family)